MDFKQTAINLLVALILSPVVVYIVLTIARLAGSNYEMSHGEIWMIWVLMAILINQCIVKKN